MPTETFLHAIEVVLNQLGKPVMICEADPSKDYPIVYVNHLFEVMSGYSRSFAEGRNPRFLHAKNHDSSVLQALREALRRRESFEGTIVNVKPSGETYPTKMTLQPVWVDGAVLYYVAIYEPFLAPNDPAILAELGRILNEVQVKYKLIEKALNHTHDRLEEAKQ